MDFVFYKESVVMYQGDKFTASVIRKNEIILCTKDKVLGKKYCMMLLNLTEIEAEVYRESIFSVSTNAVEKCETGADSK